MTLLVKALSLDMAKKVIAAAQEKARELKLKIAVAIMDEHGNLKCYERMDGNNSVSVRMSQLKALTSASIPISTKALGERNMTLENGPYLAAPGIILLEGGLPIITDDGQHIGAIGVSGALPHLDGICARAGLDAIKADLA